MSLSKCKPNLHRIKLASTLIRQGSVSAKIRNTHTDSHIVQLNRGNRICLNSKNTLSSRVHETNSDGWRGKSGKGCSGISRNYCTAAGTSPSPNENSNDQNEKYLSSVGIKTIRPEEIQSYFKSKDLRFTDGFTCFTTSCPKLKRPKMKDKSFVNKTTGSFVCKTCQKIGNWDNFVDIAETALLTRRVKLSEPCFIGTKTDQRNARKAVEAQKAWSKGLDIVTLSEQEFDDIQSYLNIRSLNRETLQRFDVRVVETKNGLIFPSYNIHGDISSVKITTYKQHEDLNSAKINIKNIPSLDETGIFGLNTVNKETKMVLTANEFDAMAISQECEVIALALPSRARVLNLPIPMLPSLEQFKEIIVWFGGAVQVWDSAKQFALKLNASRCSLIRPSEGQGALACLASNKGLTNILQTAHPASSDSIVTFSSLRKDVFLELSNVDQFEGVKWTRFPALNKLLKGHRRGELTILTGPTGSGKTTFISEYSLDLAMRGVNTLWGSFEINNVRMLKTMLHQFSMKNMTQHINEYDHWADKFEKLPIYFMTFHGEENAKRVLSTMAHAVYVHDIAHVIVDNLQFMMGTGVQANERFFRQDKVIQMFRSFATKQNCHVTLIIHPRKERETEDLTVASIFGSAKASQEADNILLLQDKRLQQPRGGKVIQVAKNRYDGDLGFFNLKFNKDSKSFQAPKKAKTIEEEGENVDENEQYTKHETMDYGTYSDSND